MTAALMFVMGLAAGVPAADVCHPLLHSNNGCEYFAVALPNPIALQSEQLNAVQYPFAVDLMNTSSSTAVDVTISGGALSSQQTVQVSAGNHILKILPKVYSLWGSTGTATYPSAAYHIVSTGLLSAVQFNTVDPTAGSNDASLLLPVQSGGLAYRVAAWATENFGGPDYPGQVGIVATRPTTTVHVQASSGQLVAGAGLSSAGGFATLGAGDVLLLSAASSEDLSGTLITSDAPILVWSSHAGAQIPFGELAADHMEESIPPISAAGTDYFLVRPINPAGTPSGARQKVQLVGTLDGTTLTYDPVTLSAPLSINAGQSVIIDATADFRVQSNAPIIAAAYMQSGSNFGAVDTDGDPSEFFPAPTNNARRSISFFAPQTFAPSYAQLVAPTGASVTIDSDAVTGWTPIGASGYSSSNVVLCCADLHRATGDKPFTLSVYSYPPGYTSFWYSAALGVGDDIFWDGLDF